MLALQIPGLNAAFLTSFIAVLVMTYGVVWYGKRRPADRKATWGEAMAGAVYVFFAMFIAFGVVPHQFIDHADKELGWSKEKLLNGPFDLLKAKVNGGHFPFTVSYQALRDIIVMGIHVLFFVIMGFVAAWWQRRGQAQAKELSTSSYGRPLVKKA